MDSSKLTPQQSLDLITGVIREAKARYQENGLIYVYWGLVIAVISLADFVLRTQDLYNLIWVPYMAYPVAVLASYLLFRQQWSRGPRNLVGNLLRRMWFVITANILVLGFAFAMVLAEHLVPVILILLGLALSISGFTLNYRILIRAGIFTNAVGLGTFFVPYEYHPLVMAITALISVFGSGFVLWQAHRKRSDV